MGWKKNWFGCIIWAFYSIVLCVTLATYMNMQCAAWKIGKYGTVFTVCAAFLGIFGISWLLCEASSKWGYRFRDMSVHTKVLWELFLLLSVFAGAFLIRFYWYMHTPAGDGSMEFYKMAVIREDGGVPFIRHGASYLYAGVLSAVFSFLGNKFSAGIAFQILCQLAGILLLYFGIKNLAGTVAAVAAFAMTAFLPAMLSLNFILTPESLYFFLFSGMLFLVSCYRKSAGKKKTKTFFGWMGLVLLGAGIGYVTYLDVTGVLLFLLLFYILLSTESRAGEKAGSLAASFLGFGLVFMLFLWLGSLSVKEPFRQALLSWWRLYFPFLPGNGKIAVPDVTVAGNLLAGILSAGYVVGFWFQERDMGRGYILSMLVLTVFVLGGKPNMDYQVLVTLYGAVLAGVGAASVLDIKKSEPIPDPVPDRDAQAGKTAETKKTGKIPDLIIEEIGPDEKPEKIRFIENPLPLPKKHKKKTMGYRFEPEEDRMKYDIEVKDGDDFDLK